MQELIIPIPDTINLKVTNPGIDKGVWSIILHEASNIPLHFVEHNFPSLNICFSAKTRLESLLKTLYFDQT